MEKLDNYKKEKLTINLGWAYIFGILILIPIALIFGLPYYMLWMDSIDVKNILYDIAPDDVAHSDIFVFVILILGIVIHELIHGATWSMFAKHGFKSIKFGILWGKLTPYCHCEEPLMVKHYIMGAITPAIILGFIPSILAILIGCLLYTSDAADE